MPGKTEFSLMQFPSSAGGPDGLSVTGSITRDFGIVSVSYLLTGGLSNIVIPDIADIPRRGEKLWEDTCFELFISLKDSEPYWEFNISPAGHWNVYRFNKYREGKVEEAAFDSLPVSVQKEAGCLLISIRFDSGRIIPAGSALKAGISAVIRLRDSGVTHWALTHKGHKPDFHIKENFIIEL
ncbi:MAG: DOMON-like domain-containing protein [Nitrospirae bacterium]|nr:DOMON-like domain-containing protein [Nitrospirota bacterium]